MIFRRLLSSSLRSVVLMATNASSSYADFQKELSAAKHIMVLTGAGVSAESGIPTFRGAGGLWRTYESQKLATPESFEANPSLVWEFYHYRREVVFKSKPNPGHYALAELEKKWKKQGREVVIITQNIDGLHAASGSKNILELHGSLFKTRCLKCGDVTENRDRPICPALKDKGSPDPKLPASTIPESDLPRCKKCAGLVRPAVVWFGECLDSDILDSASNHLNQCDLCLIVGTSAVVQPSASFGMEVAMRGVTVAEFNPETTPNTGFVKYHFAGPSGETLPKALGL